MEKGLMIVLINSEMNLNCKQILRTFPYPWMTIQIFSFLFDNIERIH